MKTVYLDHAATSPIAPEVRDAMLPFLDAEFGNPSSRYPLGVRAKEALDVARAQVARATGARALQVTFTSGGTEADNLGVIGLARARKRFGRRVVIGPTEHPAVRASAFALEAEGFEVRVARLTDTGALDLDSYEELVDEETVVVAQMLVSNELGTVYPVADVARIVRRRAPHAGLHTDAVQAIGKIDVSLEELGVDTLAISAHKIHAPKGTGALVRRADVAIEPVLYGGGQESGLRSGTENVAGIVALGVAAKLADERREETVEHVSALRRSFTAGISDTSGFRVLEPGSGAAGVSPTICTVLVPGAPAEVWLHHLEARGICASAGSACQTGKKDISPAYEAARLSVDEARHVLRFSFARETTADEIGLALDVLRELAPTLEAVHP